MPTIQQLLAERIQTARKAAKLSQSDLAARAQLSPQTINRAEGGIYLIQESTVTKIAKALDVPVAQLMVLPNGNGHAPVSRPMKPPPATSTRAPWECPRCHAMNAPWADRCGCPPPELGA